MCFCPYTHAPHVDVHCQTCQWLAAAIAQPKRRQPPILGVDSPLRPLHVAARTIYLARKLEAAERARAAQEVYNETVADYRANMVAAQALGGQE